MALKRGDEFDDLRDKLATAPRAMVQWHVGSEYIWLEHVLCRLWKDFVKLHERVEADAKEKAGAAHSYYQQWLARLRECNPEATGAEIDAEARLLSGFDKKPLDRVTNGLGTLMPIYCEVAILSAALCEAHINLALAWGLTMLDRESSFTLIEKSTTIEKWQHGPKLLFEGYELPSHSAEFETLSRVFSERNVLMHPKSSISKDGKERVTPKFLKTTSTYEVIQWLPRFFSLPFDLAEFLKRQPSVGGFNLPYLSHREDVPRASAHKLACVRR